MVTYSTPTVTYPGKKRSLSISTISKSFQKLYQLSQTETYENFLFLIAYQDDNKNLNGYTISEFIQAIKCQPEIPNNIIFNTTLEKYLHESN